jgi:site-specific recombinase XerD
MLSPRLWKVDPDSVAQAIDFFYFSLTSFPPLLNIIMVSSGQFTYREDTMEQKIVKDTEVLEGSFTAALSRLVENLSATGYTQRVSEDYIRVVKHFCYWHIRHAAAKVMDESRIKEFLEHLASCTCPVAGRGSYRLCHAAATHFLTVLREMRLAPPVRRSILPEDKVLQAFQEHLTRVRGTVETSASLYARHLRPFLQSIYTGEKFAFHAVTVRDVEAFVARMATQYKPQTVKLYCTSLRAFFRFLRLRGEIELPLEDAVPTVPHWRLSSIPKYLTEEQVTAFLSSFDVDTTAGLRNRAMAFLMATAGLRVGEVANMKIEDINWRKSSIKLQNTKSRHIDYLPLVSKAGEALAAYLKRRPQTETRRIFITLTAPSGRPLNAGAIRAVMRRVFKRCFPSEPTRGTHVLRHSLATRMLTKGATFKEIADILRHRNIETTAIYAKVDLKGLTDVVFPWPEVTI